MTGGVAFEDRQGHVPDFGQAEFLKEFGWFEFKSIVLFFQRTEDDKDWNILGREVFLPQERDKEIPKKGKFFLVTV